MESIGNSPHTNAIDLDLGVYRVRGHDSEITRNGEQLIEERSLHDRIADKLSLKSTEKIRKVLI